ncbi:S-adenosylmethionine-binding domain-containing protein [Bradyrhizobium sp. Bra78]|uniref:S-adenosylmethionine-binding domain-containing protein n=1 Tax=Bradyrhizobium sp. Bra78 TaxID=2926010 RepID=UPI0021C8EFC7|nr:S-adenosylmethionine-binding domain-containing protein [Bradyrhizobium sp. Bra78]
MTELVRYEAARRALAEAVAVDEVIDIRSKAEAMRVYARQASDKGLEIQAAQIRFRAERRLGEMIVAQKETVGLNAGSRGQLAGKSDSGGAVVEQPEDERPRLADIGIDRKLSSKAQKLAAMDAAEFEQALDRHRQQMESGAGRVAMDLLKIDAEEKGRIHRRDLASALSSVSSVAPSGRLYPALSADPPWHRKAGIGNRAYENHYPTMPWPEILDYLKRAGEALLPDAWAWMWIPRAHLLAKVPLKTEVMLADGECVMATVDLPLAYACQLALGMDAYSTCYVWTKTDAEHPDVSGSGLLVWDQDELLLQFKRGRGLPKPESSEKFGSNHRERPREHSRKPDFYRHMIATMVGKDSDGAPLPVLELFARVDAEHPLPENWGAWGNQAGVSAQRAEASPDALREAFVAANAGRDPYRLWDHPAVHGEHVVSMTRDYPGGIAFNVATCRCGWSFRCETKPFDLDRDAAVDAHWREIIAKHDLPAPSGEAEPAAAKATSQGASAAAAALASQDAMRNATDAAASPSSARDNAAPYNADDVLAIDQLAGSEWLAPADADAQDVDDAARRDVRDEDDAAHRLGERQHLKILSDFCHTQRDLQDVIGPLYVARGYCYQSASQQWTLRGAGWDRLRELEAAELTQGGAPPRADLTEPYRAPQPSLFDAARQLDDTPPAEVVDGHLQTRLPVDADELAERLALISVDAGEPVAPEMLRHLVGKGLAHCGTTKISVTDDGRAFLAQLVGPASFQQQGAGA